MTIATDSISINQSNNLNIGDFHLGSFQRTGRGARTFPIIYLDAVIFFTAQVHQHGNVSVCLVQAQLLTFICTILYLKLTGIETLHKGLLQL